MVREALPLTSATTPSEVAPSRNVTLPVGTPVAGATGLTVALRVTACPTAEGLGVDVKLVVVLARFTVCVTAAEVLAENARYPLYATMDGLGVDVRVVTVAGRT